MAGQAGPSIVAARPAPWDQSWCEIASGRVNWRGQNRFEPRLLTPSVVSR
jgi:hypothetical protein